VGCHREDVHPPDLYLHDEQHIRVFEEDRVHGEELARQQAPCLGAQEPPPGGVQAAQGEPVAAGAEHPSHGRLTELVAETGRLAVHPTASEAGFSFASRSTRPRISWPTAGRPGRLE